MYNWLKKVKEQLPKNESFLKNKSENNDEYKRFKKSIIKSLDKFKNADAFEKIREHDGYIDLLKDCYKIFKDEDVKKIQRSLF